MLVTTGEGGNEETKTSKHVHVQGMWFKFLDLKSWLSWKFQKTSFAPKMDLKSSNSNF
jgi:hypothetical protein